MSSSHSFGGGGGRGRGEYYRQKYGGGRGRGGGGGRGGGAGRGGHGGQHSNASRRTTAAGGGGGGGGGGTYEDLRRLLLSIDGRQYPSYHDIETNNNELSGGGGGWVHNSNGVVFVLHVGRTQSDPFAPPTRCRVTVPSTSSLSSSSSSKTNHPQPLLPRSVLTNTIRRLAAADFLWRRLYENCVRMGADRAANNSGGGWKGPKGGDLQILQPTQHVTEQSAVTVQPDGTIQCCLTINLPARGRTVLGDAAWRVLGPTLAQLIQRSILGAVATDAAVAALTRHVDSIEDQVWLQQQLDGAGLVSFVRNGAILPRASGVDDRPLTSTRVVPFQSPLSLQTSFTLPNAGVTVTGMGIPKGITLICGGGFHGKSTLLEALQLAVYPKIPGDGREFCCTSIKAAKIRAEDGRAVNDVDISSFIRNLPFGDDTTHFTTADASGSTSQASNIVEAIEIGADTLLIDEDTCASNGLIRDTQMMQLVACDREPITPFVRVVSSLKEQHGISTVLVVGGTGDFFHVADHVLVMDAYRCEDATERAHQIVAQSSHTCSRPPKAPFVAPTGDRVLVPTALQPGGKIKVLARNVVAFGETEIDLSSTEQLVSSAQANAIAHALQWLSTHAPGGSNLASALAVLDQSIDNDGLAVLAPGQFNGTFMRPRLLEIAGAINRLRRNAIQKR